MSWYCLHLKGKQEFNAEQALQAQGFNVYLPRAYINEKKGNVNKKLRVEPLFPCYLFIELIEGVHDFFAVKNTKGVHNFVNNQLIEVPVSILDELRSREDEQNVHNLRQNEWQIGEKVRVKKGAFKMYEAIIAQKKNERIWIVLDNLPNQKININSADLEAV